MTRIKICGLRTEQAIETAIAAGADFIGLVHFRKSPRHVELAEAAQLARFAAGRALVVLLLVDPDDELIEVAAREVPFDLLQLHGAEPPERVRAIRARIGKPVIKAVKVSDRQDVEDAQAYLSVADYLLFDAKPPAGSQLPGGNGIPFDWNALKGFNTQKEFLLSGGLDPDNVAAAVIAIGAPIIDVSSGVEVSPGIKDPEKIKRFVECAKAAGPAGTVD